MALGATTGAIIRLVLSYAIRCIAVGIAIGFAVALAATHLLRSLLYEVPERDPLTFSLTLMVLVTVALLSVWIPARRASNVDPLVALRHD